MYEKYVRLLEQTGETTYQVCKATGVPENVISMWKDRCLNKGKDSKLSIDNLAKIARHFNVPLEYFLTED